MVSLLFFACFGFVSATSVKIDRYGTNVQGGPPTPPPLPLFGFGAAFGSNMVLQQQPAKAAVYGFFGPGGSAVTVTVASGDKFLYNVTATPSTQHQPFGEQDGFGPRPCLKESCPPYDMTPFNFWNKPLPGWKALLQPTVAGGNYTITATCTGCAVNTTVVSITNVTFGDMWYCSGQSNMWLPVLNSFSRNDSVAAIKAGKYTNIRLMAGGSGTTVYDAGGVPNESPKYGGFSGSNKWMTAEQAVADGTVDAPSYSLFEVGATCWYFAQKLSELGVTTPIGIADTAIGGQRIEEYMYNATGGIDKCTERAGENIPWWDSQLYATQVTPFVDMTVKGWVWYQGENNMGATKGNSIANIGYACEQRELIKGWRKVWSETPGTTDPNAPFGVVTLASSGSEGGPNMGAMRMAQTASYGILPNEALPNTFMAQAYDLDDEWGPAAGPCFTGYGYNFPAGWNCCDSRGDKPNPFNATSCTAEREKMCTTACSAMRDTQSHGGIHPRSKKYVGDRLGQACYNTIYEGKDAFTGPTLSGCQVNSNKLVIQFNTSLLRGDKLFLNKYNRTGVAPVTARHGSTHGGSFMYVQTNATLFCMEEQRFNKTCQEGKGGNCPLLNNYCPSWAGGPAKPKLFPAWPRDTIDTNWTMVPFDIGSTPGTIEVDLTLLNGTMPTAVKYAWDITDCCDYYDPTLYITHGCVANCPIMASPSQFPANPFKAKIVDGKCSCVAPQIC